MNNYFTNAFEKLENKEEFYKAIIMNTDSQEAEKIRCDYYSLKFKSMGKNVQIGVGVRIINPQYISVGDNVKIQDGATLIARGPGGITIGNNVWINQRVYLDTERYDTGYIKIADSVYIGTGTCLFGHMGLEIGDHALLAQNITLTPYSHCFSDPNSNIITQGGHCEKVLIGRDSYIGMNVSILYSGNVGEGSVIGSGAVVVKPIPPYSVAVGNPAKVIKSRKNYKL